MKYIIEKKFVIFQDDTEEVYIRISSITTISVGKNPSMLFLRSGDYLYNATFDTKEQRKEFFLKLKEKIH